MKEYTHAVSPSWISVFPIHEVPTYGAYFPVAATIVRSTVPSGWNVPSFKVTSPSGSMERQTIAPSIGSGVPPNAMN